MLIISCLYLLLIYLLFFQFKLLPWNRISQVICLFLGVVILTGILVGLQGLTPSSSQSSITDRIVEIAKVGTRTNFNGKLARFEVNQCLNL
jgi:hypothetical protein